MLYRILLSRPGPAVGVLAAVTLSWALVGWLLIELVRWAAFALNAGFWLVVTAALWVVG